MTEDNKTTITTTPKVTLKKLAKGYGWDIALSEDLTLSEIIEKVEEANNIMLEKFGKEKK